MATSVLADATRPYSFLESWSYDRIIAPSVISMLETVIDQWQPLLATSASVLDVGCGGGQGLALMSERHTGIRLTGIDLSKDQVNRARRRLSLFFPRVSVQQGSALELPYADASFDVVVSIASIKHWPDQQRGLQECARVLKPNGTLLMVEVDRACSLPDTEAFIRGWKIPPVLRPFAMAIFRTWVAGHSIDVLDAQQLLANLPLRSTSVTRIAGTPALLMQGVKNSVQK